jgi:heptosyltransferase I
MKIAIVMLSAVGDTVHVLPIINALKRHDSANNITWLLNPAPATLVRGHPSIDQIIELPPRPTLPDLLDLRRHHFDLVLDLQVALKAGLATAALSAPVKLGFDRARARDLNWLFTTRKIPPHPGRQHVQDQYFEFLDALSIPHGVVEWHLGPYPAERPAQQQFFSQFTRPIAALSIGATDPDREWLPDRWAAVADALSTTYGLHPVLVGAATPRAQQAAATIQSLSHHPVANALGSGLRPLVSILDGAALVISVDTATVHMSVALDRPVITLMSNADPRRTGPYRHSQDLIIDAYHDLGAPIPPEISWTRHPNRMPLITVDTVLSRLSHWHSTHSPNTRHR